MISESLKILSVLSLLASSAFAEPHLRPDKEYQKVWCDKAGGVTEVILDDMARVDCLTEEYAIEFDFGPKWAESIGQALYYGIKTGKRPGVVLIMEKDSDLKYFGRLSAVAEKHNIKVWITKPKEVRQLWLSPRTYNILCASSNAMAWMFIKEDSPFGKNIVDRSASCGVVAGHFFRGGEPWQSYSYLCDQKERFHEPWYRTKPIHTHAKI